MQQQQQQGAWAARLPLLLLQHRPAPAVLLGEPWLAEIFVVVLLPQLQGQAPLLPLATAPPLLLRLLLQFAAFQLLAPMSGCHPKTAAC